MEILVTWDPVPEMDCRGVIDHYEVQFNQSTFSEIPSVISTVTDGPVLMLSLQNLEAFVEYSIAVRAYTSVGAGPFTPIVNNQTFQDGNSVAIVAYTLFPGLLCLHAEEMSWPRVFTGPGCSHAEKRVGLFCSYSLIATRETTSLIIVQPHRNH